MPIHGTLFHAALADLRGDAVLPLNEMRDHFPDLHARHAAKYAGRESVRETRVPPLGCTWGDVPHVLHRGPIPAALLRR